LPQADFVALTCPLTKETENLIDAKALGLMKRLAFLVNVAPDAASTSMRSPLL
jgi:D-2-hydroxyacid dehydrogenase (NADP+)